MKYFGLYCPQCNEWLKKDDQTLLFYPAREIAEAHRGMLAPRWHEYGAVVVEYGTEQRIDPQKMPPATILCNTLMARRRPGMEVVGRF